MRKEVQCHICEGLTEYYCADCGKPVCEDCCVVPTYENQLEETLCKDCGYGRDARRETDYSRKYAAEKVAKEKKEARSKAAKARYWTVENIKKRRLAKEERNRQRAERNIKAFQEAMKVVGDMFK